MSFHTLAAIGWIWGVLGLVWLVGYIFRKRTLRTQPLASRMFYVAVALLGCVFLGTHWLERGWLALRFVPGTEQTGLAGFVLTLAGAAFAVWARITLGKNWSGRPSVKADHELIIRGPYALARHPIYSGLLLGLAGTALAVGQWRAVIGVFLVGLAFIIKMANEEQFMMQTFPDVYPAYRKRVKALIPGVL